MTFKVSPLLALFGAFRRHRRATATLAYAAIASAALALAYLARFEFDPRVLTSLEFIVALTVLIGVRLAVNARFRMGMWRWRFVDVRDLMRLFMAETVGSVLFFALLRLIPATAGSPRSVVLLEWVFNGYLTGGMWVTYRLLYERVQVRKGGRPVRTIVVGAGEAGAQLVHQMQRSSAGMIPVGLVDDDPFKWGTLVHGVEVLGRVADLGAIGLHVAADQVLIAVPSATSQQIRTIVEHAESTGLPLKIFPSLEAALRGDIDLESVRDIQIEDLLGRDPIRLELPRLAERLRSRCVLVTGAAGSIGSELCRQIALHQPERLVMLDQAETPLFYLERDITEEFPDLEVVCSVGDVTLPEVVEDVVASHRPNWVFHAAAYKHVPVMEKNPREAVRTNILGTRYVGEAAGRHGVERFILISTDKAVEPANIMGATKHVAERVVLRLQHQYPDCAFGAVRFGNVLGSSGSVIPIFRQQLRRGEPLTVTHEDVTRYFMTIPEAVQLILQSSLLDGLRGHVAMLDMGEPVRILDLARDLLRLSGRPFRLGETVVVSGLRPGEKLHERLAARSEAVTPTEVERVLLVTGNEDDVRLEALLDAADENDVDALLDGILDVFTEVKTAPVVGRRSYAGTPG